MIRLPRKLPSPRLLSLLLAAAAASCGGSGNPLENPGNISNPAGTSGSKLSFLYYQRCINPIFLAALPITLNGQTQLKTCSAAGCHDSLNGNGGAFRIIPTATQVNVAASTPDAIRLTDMYKNFYSTQGETIIGSPGASLLLNKPLLLGVLHAGGQVFANGQDANAQRMAYWITNPMPAGQDEFSPAGNSLFTPADATTGTCNG